MSNNNLWRLVLCLLFSLTLTTVSAQDSNMSAEELVRQLQAQNANLQGRLDRVEASRTRLIEQIDTLESAATTSTEAISTEAMSVEATEVSMPVVDSSAQLARTQGAYDRLKQQMADLQSTNSQLEARIDRELASKARTQSQHATLQESAATAEAHVEDMSAEIASLKTQRKVRVRQILDLQKRVGAASAVVAVASPATAVAAASVAEAPAAEASVDVDKIQTERDLAVQRIAELRGQINTLQADSSAMQASTETMQADAAKTLSERNIAVERIAELRGQINTLQADSGEMQASAEAMQASTEAMQADAAKTLNERNIAVERIAELREQMNSLQADNDTMQANAEAMQASTETTQTDAAKILSERNLAVSRISELRSDFAAQQAESAEELSKAIKLGDRARAQRTAALEKLKAMQTEAMTQDMTETVVKDAPEVMTETVVEETAPASVQTNQANAIESLDLYRTLAARVSAGESLSAEEQSQYDSALDTLRNSQKLVAEQMGGSTYTVVEGDNLSAIALQEYGDGSRYLDILDANSYLIDNPDLIFPGFELVLPQ